jgi:hypothetical protein
VVGCELQHQDTRIVAEVRELLIGIRQPRRGTFR